MTKPNALHHLAICTADMKAQIAFFTDVLGMELVALYWMHGVAGAWHGFLKLNDKCSIALVYSPDIAAVQPVLGKTHSGNPGGPAAPGTMQHLALNVDGMDALLTMRDRIRAKGVNVFGPIDHGFCQSIYFAGPENLSLELSTSAEAIDPQAWIDPEVVALAGISPDELAQYKSPAPFARPAAPVPQPAMDPAKPHMRFPAKVYQRMLAMSDADYTARMSEPEPPVKAAAAE
jgi:catechol 2,3-dioxygenase-like lactoylglutathione lyase family enzyme